MTMLDIDGPTYQGWSDFSNAANERAPRYAASPLCTTLLLMWSACSLADNTLPSESVDDESDEIAQKAAESETLDTDGLAAGNRTASSGKKPSGLAAFDTRRTADQTPQWIEGYDPEYFTLQIVSVNNEESARRLVESIAVLGRDKGYVGYELEGAVRYGAFIGVYPRYRDARRALEQLPPHLQEYEPWIRKVKDVQHQALP